MIWLLGAIIFGLSCLLIAAMVFCILAVILVKLIEDPIEVIGPFALFIMIMGIPIGSALMESDRTPVTSPSSIAVEDSR